MEFAHLVALIGAAATIIAAIITAQTKQGADAVQGEPTAPVLPRLTGEICAGLGLVSLLLPWRELNLGEAAVGQSGFQMMIGTSSVHGGTGQVSAEEFGRSLQSGYPLFYLAALGICLYVSLTSPKRDTFLIEGIMGAIGLLVLILQVILGDHFIRTTADVRLSYGIGFWTAGIMAAALPIIARWNALSRTQFDLERSQKV